MKKTMKMFIAALMVTVLALVTPLQICAAQKKTYISDLQVIYASSYDAAKSKATSGYTVISQQMDGEEGVWLSYKSTTNKDEAITDISVMNMKGDYRFDDFDKMLAEKVEMVQTYVKGLMVAVNGYKKNYNAGNVAAVYAHDVLNKLYEDDSKEYMGDLLLGDNAETTLNKIVLQCRPLVVDTIITYLGIACDGNWVDEIDEGEEVGTNPDASDRAQKLYKYLPNLRDGLKEYEDSGIDIKSLSKDELKDYIENANPDDVVKLLSFGMAYETLGQKEYQDGTLLDFFLKESSEISQEDLYPIAAAMSDELVTCLGSLGLEKAVTFSGATQKGIDTVRDLGTIDSIEAVSVYTGIDRSVYDGKNIAMTDSAIRALKSTQTSDSDVDPTLAFISSGASMGCVVVNSESLLDVLKTEALKFGVKQIFKRALVKPLIKYLEIKVLEVGETVIGMLKKVGFILIVAAVMLYIAKQDPRDVTYTQIPRIIVDRLIKNDKESYVVYQAVQSTEGKYADLNNWKGSQWNALYYTRDTKAGNPLTTDYITVSDLKNLDTDRYTVAHPFDSTAAFNLNAFHFSKQASLYLGFAPAVDVQQGTGQTATILSMTGYAISAAAGLAVGVVGVLLFRKMRLSGKEKL